MLHAEPWAIIAVTTLASVGIAWAAGGAGRALWGLLGPVGWIIAAIGAASDRISESLRR